MAQIIFQSGNLLLPYFIYSLLLIVSCVFYFSRKQVIVSGCYTKMYVVCKQEKPGVAVKLQKNLQKTFFSFQVVFRKQTVEIVIGLHSI